MDPQSIYTSSCHYGNIMTRYHTVFCSVCAVLLVLSCACAGCTSSQNQAPAQGAITGTALILVKNFAFTPDVLTIKPGTKVTWTNQDGTTHQIGSDAGSSVAFSSDPLPDGASYQFTFSAPGTYTYHCLIHPSMTGTIVVQP